MCEYALKIVLIGDTHVGKSSICNSIIGKNFEYCTNQTIGVDFFTTTIIHNQNKFKMHIWDTAGQERFRSITKTYYRNSAGVFCVFDVTRKQTEEHLQNWVNDIENISPNSTIIFVGNKIDMLPENQNIDQYLTSVKKFVENRKYQLITVSSKTNTNIKNMLEMMVDTIHKTTIQNQIVNKMNTNGIVLTNTQTVSDDKKKPCCKT